MVVGRRFWRPKVGAGGFCWFIFRFTIGGSIWGGKFALESGEGLRLEGEVRELLVDGRLEAGLEIRVFDV